MDQSRWGCKNLQGYLISWLPRLKARPSQHHQYLCRRPRNSLQLVIPRGSPWGHPVSRHRMGDMPYYEAELLGFGAQRGEKEVAGSRVVSRVLSIGGSNQWGLLQSVATTRPCVSTVRPCRIPDATEAATTRLDVSWMWNWLKCIWRASVDLIPEKRWSCPAWSISTAFGNNTPSHERGRGYMQVAARHIFYASGGMLYSLCAISGG